MSLEQRLFSTQAQRALLEQWRKADKYRLSTQEFCQALVDNGTPTQKKIGQAGLAAPSQGQRFVDTLQGWFPNSLLLTLRAADKAGQLGVGIDSALAQLEGGENVMMDIARLLAFPFALCLGAGVYGVFISGNILETLDFADGVGMQTRQFVIDHGLWVALALVGWFVGMSFALPHWRGALRSKLDNWPIFSLYRASVATSTLSTLANLTRCGVKLQDALEQTQEGNSAFAGYHLKRCNAAASSAAILATSSIRGSYCRKSWAS
ncbi:hypothetical protein JCM19233_3086 [Vibrio astriarenae]|nr:hypothetical protein JCM19233_3086 [Vibrio sp. C7]